jgi:hypothetical protein
LWFDEDSGKLFIYHTDSNSSQWVEVGVGGSGGDGGGGDTVINYSGPAAWATVDIDGNILQNSNIASVVHTSGTPQYDYTFVTPMPDDKYSVQITENSTESSGYNIVFKAIQKTTTGFRASGLLATTGGWQGAAGPHSVTVHATNALPPTGGTGTDAWVLSTGAGTIWNSFNVSSVDRLSQGTFRVNFTTPMPSNDYCVQATISEDQYSVVPYCTEKQPAYFVIKLRNQAGALFDFNFSASVNATNATLPFTVTQAEIESFKSTVTALEAAVTRIQSLEAAVQALQTDHTTLMNNNNEGSY